MTYEEIEEKICEFDLYIKQTMDLLKDAYRWKVMSEECETDNMAMKYKQVSDTLFELFMSEHNNMSKMFKGE